MLFRSREFRTMSACCARGDSRPPVMAIIIAPSRRKWGRLSTNHQILEDNGFDDRDEIEEFQSDLNSVYQNFDYAKSKVSKQHFKFIAVLSIILSVLFAALTVYLFISGPENLSSSSSILKHNIFLGVSAVLCLGFLISS